jgi:GAF domain-containing protein
LDDADAGQEGTYPRLLDYFPRVANEDELVARSFRHVRPQLQDRLEALGASGEPASNEDVFERVFGRSDDDSPLPDFVARRLPPIAEAVGALSVEVWLLDARFRCVELLAGYSTERGTSLPRAEILLAKSGLLGPDSPPEQIVVSLIEGDAAFAYLRAFFPRSSPVRVAQRRQLQRLAHVLTYAMLGSESRRVERARNELANLGNRATEAQAFLGEIVADFLPRVLATHAASIFLVNEAGDRLALARSTGLARSTDSANPPVYRAGQGLTGYVWQHKRSLRFPDELDEHPSGREAYDPPPTFVGHSYEHLPPNTRRQFLAVPLIREREAIGVLRLGGRTGEWRFSEWDEALANALAAQIAQIYCHLRAIGEGIESKATFIKTMELLQNAPTEEEMVRVTLLALTCRQGLGFNRAAFWSFDENRRALTPVMLIGGASFDEDQTLRARTDGPIEQVFKKASTAPEFLEMSLNEAFLEQSETLLDTSDDRLSRICHDPVRNRVAIVDLGEEREADTEELRKVFGEVEARVVPLFTSGTSFGCLYVDNAFDRVPIRRDLEERVMAYARHLADAIRASRESAQRRLWHEFHRRLSAALVASADTSAMAREVLSSIRDVLGFERILIYQYDGGNGGVRLLGRHGFGPAATIASQTGELIQSLVPKVLSSHHPHFTSRSDEGGLASEFRLALGLEGPLLSFPMQLGGSGSAVLVVNDARLNPGTQFVLQSLTDMLRVAVKTIVHEERLAAQEKTIDLLREIQKGFRLAHNEDVFCKELAASLIEILPAQLCAVYRPFAPRPLQERRTTPDAMFERRGDAGYPVALSNTVKYGRTGAGAGLTSHVLAGRTLNVPQVDKDERWEGKEFQSLTDVLGGNIRAFLGVPLVASNGRILGGLTLTRIRFAGNDGLAFQRHEQELLQAIADAVATVLELNDARAALEDHVATIDALSRTHDRLMAAAVAARTPADVRGLSQGIADELRRCCAADLVVVYGLDPLSGLMSVILSGDFWHREAVVGTNESFLRSGQRTFGEYFEDARRPYNGTIPADSFAGREGVMSFAHVRVFSASGNPLMCMFVNYRTHHRFPPEQQKLIERFASNCALSIEVATSMIERPRNLRLVPSSHVAPLEKDDQPAAAMDQSTIESANDRWTVRATHPER